MSTMESVTYVINEYEIIKRIFSHLNHKELVVSSQVCRDWYNVAHRLICQSSEPCSYIKGCKSWPSLNLKMEPKLILHMSSSLLKQNLRACQKRFKDVGDALSENFNLTDATIISITNWKYISSVKCHGTYSIVHDNNDNPRESLFLLPEFSDLKIRIDVLSSDQDCDSVSEYVHKADCFLLLTGSKQDDMNVANTFMSSFSLLDKLLMVGGIAERLYRVSPEFNFGFQKVSAVVISFKGEKVSAYVDMISNSQDIKGFLSEMAKNVGPIPHGYTRIAFIFSCVNRYQEYNTLEIKEFSQCFPNVPVYGYWSLGEYFLRAPSRKRKNGCFHITQEVFYHQEVSCYLIITFKK